MIKCKHCGEKYDERESNCPFCGEQRPNDEGKQNVYTRVIIITSVVIALVVIGFKPIINKVAKSKTYIEKTQTNR